MNIISIINYLEAQLYYWQTHLSQIIADQLNHIKLSTFLLIFIIGILTSINPCNISIIPLAASYLNDSKGKQQQQYITIVGILTSVIIVLSIISIINIHYQKLSIRIPSISYIYMVIIGLNLLDVLELNKVFISMDKVKIFNKFRKPITKDYVIGFLLGVNSISCNTPILIYLMYWIAKSKFVLLGSVHIFLYMAGYSIPIFLFIQLSSNYINLIHYRDNKLWIFMTPLLGSLTLGIGVFFLLDNIFI